MAGLKEIKARIKSVKNTKKITYAMKLVAATKMRGAQEAVLNSREYSESIKRLLANVLQATAEAAIVHPLMETREVKRVALVVIGANRGLCGSYNSNVNKAIKAFYADIKAKHPGVDVEAVVLGKKAHDYYKRFALKTSSVYSELSEDPASWPLADIAKQLEISFIKKEIDAAYLIFTNFKSALSAYPKTEQLLPLIPENFVGSSAPEVNQQTIFEPSAEKVLGAFLPRMINVSILQGALNSKASEYGARMAAMDTATKNAGELVEGLTLKFNKIRQAGITSEILDIVGGANAS